jgi:hypothetical protein
VEGPTRRTARPVPRWLWWVVAALAAIGGLAWGWEWLTAVGLASVIVSVLPCALMCAAGLCMGRRGSGNGTGSSCHGADKGSPAADKSVPAAPPEK